ncbi:MAG: hypothetical protein GF344_13400, partial [Chitinivibrionales bacterium]|nr:hypothetical protein [Chitinivibrionales bacterium]MBD3357726.1 hypothetical protein [Chitinivibrionales bacterium]
MGKKTVLFGLILIAVLGKFPNAYPSIRNTDSLHDGSLPLNRGDGQRFLAANSLPSVVRIAIGPPCFFGEGADHDDAALGSLMELFIACRMDAVGSILLTPPEANGRMLDG